MEFKVYPSLDEYEKLIWETLKAFWKDPKLFKGLFPGLSPILKRLEQENSNLSLEVDRELEKLGRGTALSITRAIWTLLLYGDIVSDQVKVDYPFDLQKLQKRVFDTLQNLLINLDTEFTDLILAFWLLKQQKGFASFAQYIGSINEYLDELDEAYLEFKESGISIPKEVKPRIGEPPKIPQTTRDSTSGRRSKFMKKKKVGVN